MVGNAYFSFGTFSTTIQPNVRYGITLSASLKGMMMDIDRLSAVRVNTDNNRQVWIAFNAAQGSRHRCAPFTTISGIMIWARDPICRVIRLVWIVDQILMGMRGEML